MKKIILLLTLVACSSNPVKPEMQTEPGRAVREAILHDLRYVKDYSVNLCFGYGWMEYGEGPSTTGGPIVVNVPCESVMKILDASDNGGLEQTETHRGLEQTGNLR